MTHIFNNDVCGLFSYLVQYFTDIYIESDAYDRYEQSSYHLDNGLGLNKTLRLIKEVDLIGKHEIDVRFDIRNSGGFYIFRFTTIYMSIQMKHIDLSLNLFNIMRGVLDEFTLPQSNSFDMELIFPKDNIEGIEVLLEEKKEEIINLVKLRRI